MDLSSQPSQKIIAKVKYLEDRGHTCVFIVGNKNHTIRYCEKEICENIAFFQNIDDENTRQKNTIKQLEDNGHICVKITDKNPIKFTWCNSLYCSLLPNTIPETIDVQFENMEIID